MLVVLCFDHIRRGKQAEMVLKNLKQDSSKYINLIPNLVQNLSSFAKQMKRQQLGFF